MRSSTGLNHVKQSVSGVLHTSVRDISSIQTHLRLLTTRAFLAQALTLERMHAVIQAVQSGVNDGVAAPTPAGAAVMAQARSESYKGLCIAAKTAMLAAILAYDEFFGRVGPVSEETTLLISNQARTINALLKDALVLAEWTTIDEFLSLQLRWRQTFSRSAEVGTVNDGNLQQFSEKTPWPTRLFRDHTHQYVKFNSEAEVSVLVFGLVTSGVLIGLNTRAEQT